jgi:hypothetical protein
MLDVRAFARGRRAGPRARGASRLPLAVLAALVALALTAPAAGAAGAAFTTVNDDADGAGHCQNGNPAVNCNIYDGKEFVWLNGGPAAASLGDGTYFFAVLPPGGQHDPNDPADGGTILSTDSHGARTFTVAGGTVAYSGPHDFANNKIRLMPYDDTPNPGGVYILAICSLAQGYPANPSTCKYDAFKVNAGTPTATPLVVTKAAAGGFDKTFAWTIAKDADKTVVKQIGGSVTFNYTVAVSHDSGSVGNVKVTGTITVHNFNQADVTGVDVTDELSDATACQVTGGTGATIPGLGSPGGGSKDFPYECALGAVPAEDLFNTATASWGDQTLVPDGFLGGGSAGGSFGPIVFAENQIDDCVAVTDSFAGSLGQACVGGVNPTSFTYARTVPVPQFDCASYDNTATFTANDTGATGSADRTVTVCGPARTGALTIGFWQNKNGQALIANAGAVAGVCKLTPFLRAYAPFADLGATASCSAVATYVTNVIKAANASGAAMNAMLKAQMLGTALDVYFSDATLGGNRIGAPGPIGAVSIDLTRICVMIGSGTTSSCSGSFRDVSGSFGGASSLTVSQMLAYAASRSNTGGSLWYGNVKSVQEGAKNAFDAVNNQVAFAA